MTREEASRLKVGDRVKCVLRDESAPVVVVGPGRIYLRVRRLGPSRGGRPHRSICVICRQLFRDDLDPLPANVYADWLDEMGEAAAAAKLRAAFPLPPPTESAS